LVQSPDAPFQLMEAMIAPFGPGRVPAPRHPAISRPSLNIE
jgi:hypothetical protein